MKKTLIFLVLLFAFQVTIAQWPKDIKAKGGAVITIYQPQPETIKGNVVDGRGNLFCFCFSMRVNS